jgi:hypothetical protein
MNLKLTCPCRAEVAFYYLSNLKTPSSHSSSTRTSQSILYVRNITLIRYSKILQTLTHVPDMTDLRLSSSLS